MNDIASWLAPAATVVAAVMTAANLGAKVTGWGFVVFTIGSISWCVVAVGTGEQNLLFTNGFLTMVNALGIWRWLGRQSRYDDGSMRAAMKSAVAKVPTLIALGSIAGRKLTGRDGQPIGVIIDGMLRCSDRSIAYIVVSEGGVGGVGERLHALCPDELTFFEDEISSDLGLRDLQKRRAIAPGAWPKSVSAA